MKSSLSLLCPLSLSSFCAAIVVTLAISSVVAPTVAAAVYKTIDKQGNIIYTDTPPAETAASEVILPPINPISSPADPAPAAARSPVSSDADPVTTFTGYSFIALASPLDGTLVHFDEPNLLAQLALTPGLEADHLVQFYVDGSAYGSAIPSLSLSIAGLERGSHRISARVLSSRGAILAVATPVTVQVQRHFKRN
ncbi:MAG: DUF4124 domain-containing protein [Porticoccaceae bacterium]|jgi:hypothetical protein|nr:DUF4124 domain-containing protein [Porticoccaceae bacterium]